jgi:asparagine synthase (glutamine-hydrolysing)
MCGICGKLNFDNEEPVSSDLLKRMMEVLRHRGPDGEGDYLSGPIGLGHRRLSIIDLSTGDQPMSNEDGSVWVVYNGEIYNFHELRSRLQTRGHTFKSAADTEVIVHLYEEMGVDCVGSLRGMFAFALWDERQKVLLLARDRVGIKPLYYINNGRSLLFSSEIKAILTDPSIDRQINRAAIDRFLTYHYLPGRETLLKGIHKLDPGHFLVACKGKIEVRQYWDLQFSSEARRISFGEAVQDLRSLLCRTVKDHMMSDVPVGVLLSGGVDSTGVLRYAAEQTDQPLHTFTIGFEGEQFADERPYARLASQRYGTRHQEITMSARDFLDFLPKYVWHMEEPVCEPPAVALYFVSHLARQSSVKVLLSGEGGDEAFGGYQNYRNLVLLEGLKSAFGPAKGLLRYGLQTLGRIGWKRAAPYSRLIDAPISFYYLSRTMMRDAWFDRFRKNLYTVEFLESLRGQETDEITQKLFERVAHQPLLNRMLYVDTKTWLPDDLLVKADKMTMATSVELRVPLLDFQILEFAASVPPHFKVLGWSTKRLLKAALAESVPKEILMRRKSGFPVPYETWLRSELKEFVFDTLLSETNFLSTFFQRQAVNHLLQSNQKGEGFSKEIFCLLVLELLSQSLR